MPSVTGRKREMMVETGRGHLLISYIASAKYKARSSVSVRKGEKVLNVGG